MFNGYRKEVKHGNARKWDFNTAIGETITERFETFLKFVNEIVEKDLDGFKCIKFISNPGITSIFEVAAKGFEPSSVLNSLGDFSFAGVGHYKYNYYVYKMITMPINQAILISKEKSVCIEIENFFI